MHCYGQGTARDPAGVTRVSPPTRILGTPHENSTCKIPVPQLRPARRREQQPRAEAGSEFSSCNHGGARIHCSNAAGRVLGPCTLPPPTPLSRRQEGSTPVKKKVLASGRAGLQLLESSECWVQLFAGPRMFGTRRALTFMGHESWAMKGVPRFMARPCLPACGISCATSVRVLVTRCESHGAPAAPTGAALCSCGCGGCRNES